MNLSDGEVMVTPRCPRLPEGACASPFVAQAARAHPALLAITDVPAAQPACVCCQTPAVLAVASVLVENFVCAYSASTPSFRGTGAMLAPP
jgi:hypothetical protein